MLVLVLSAEVVAAADGDVDETFHLQAAAMDFALTVQQVLE